MTPLPRSPVRPLCAAVAFMLGLALWAAPAVAQNPAPTAPASALDGLRLVAGPITLPEIKDDLSGIAWNMDTGTLLLVSNGDPIVYEYTTDFRFLRTIEFPDFHDMEDLVYIQGGWLAVIEERRRMLHVAKIDADTRRLPRSAMRASLRIEEAPENNVGLEGLAYTPGRFYITKEKQPRRIYTVETQGAPDRLGAVAEPWDAETHHFELDDLAGIFWHAGTGHLLLLSEESKAIVEVTPDGREIARMALRAGVSGLTSTPPQPEGITMDDAGRLYIVSEPNLVYVFARSEALVTPEVPHARTD